MSSKFGEQKKQFIWESDNKLVVIGKEMDNKIIAILCKAMLENSEWGSIGNIQWRKESTRFSLVPLSSAVSMNENEPKKCKIEVLPAFDGSSP